MIVGYDYKGEFSKNIVKDNEGKATAVIQREGNVGLVLVPQDVINKRCEPDILKNGDSGEVIVYNRTDDMDAPIQLMTTVVGILGSVKPYSREEIRNIIEDFDIGEKEDDIFMENNQLGVLHRDCVKPSNLIANTYFLGGGGLAVEWLAGQLVFIQNNNQLKLIDYDGSIRDLTVDEQYDVTFFNYKDVLRFVKMINKVKYKQDAITTHNYSMNQMHKISFYKEISGSTGMTYIDMIDALSSGMEFEVNNEEPKETYKPNKEPKKKVMSSVFDNTNANNNLLADLSKLSTK